MQVSTFQAALFSVMAAISLGTHGHHGMAAVAGRGPDSMLNSKELSLPLTNKKLVIAHCMTNIIRYKGHKFEDSCNPEYYSPEGNISAPLGGLTQVNVMADGYLSEATLDEAVEFEMRAAIESGIDGFQFYYTLGSKAWDEIIKAYFRVADKKNLDFKFTFCISHPSGGNEKTRIDEFSSRMNDILNDAGRANPHWLRSPDGRLIIYMWYGETLADVPANLDGYPPPYYVASAYKKLATAVNEKFACIVSINEQISKEKLDRYLDYFPAVWLWTLPYTDHYIGNMVANECTKRGRIFTGSAFPDFYTSKLLKKGTWDMYHYVGDAVKAGIANTERKYIATGLSYNFRKQLEFDIEKDVPLINIITWNDYPEGHHLAPEANHNDGFSVLLKYYKSTWKKELSPFANEQIIIAFYKKYGHTVIPSPFNIPVVEIEKAGVLPNCEDSIEVITIVTGKSSITVNNHTVDVPAGLRSTKFAPALGPVQVFLHTGNNKTERLACPEWITGKPYRTDRLTYSFSNRFAAFYKKIFGESPLIYSPEYNAEAAGNRTRFYKTQAP